MDSHPPGLLEAQQGRQKYQRHVSVLRVRMQFDVLSLYNLTGSQPPRDLWAREEDRCEY